MQESIQYGTVFRRAEKTSHSCARTTKPSHILSKDIIYISLLSFLISFYDTTNNHHHTKRSTTTTKVRCHNSMTMLAFFVTGSSFLVQNQTARRHHPVLSLRTMWLLRSSTSAADNSTLTASIHCSFHRCGKMQRLTAFRRTPSIHCPFVVVAGGKFQRSLFESVESFCSSAKSFLFVNEVNSTVQFCHTIRQ